MVNSAEGYTMTLAAGGKDACLDELKANARLIAAAPELLHALKAIAPIVHAFTQDELSVTTFREAHEILSRMQSAISKAEGRA